MNTGTDNMSSTTIVSPRFQIVTLLPGLAGRELTLIFANAGINYIKFVNKNGLVYNVQHVW